MASPDRQVFRSYLPSARNFGLFLMVKVTIAALIILLLTLHVNADALQDCTSTNLSPMAVREACTKVINANPSAAVAYLKRADAEQIITHENYRNLLADYNTALMLDRRLARTNLGRVRVLRARTDFKVLLPAGTSELAENAAIAAEMLTDINRVVELEPDNVEGRIQRGNLLFGLGSFKAAQADYDTVVKLRPTWSTAHDLRGSALLHTGDYVNAIKDFSVSIDLTKKPADKNYRQRGLAYSLNGEHALALKDFNRLIAEKRESWSDRLHRSFTLFNMENYKSASKALEETENHADNVQSLLLRFHSIHRAGQHLDPTYSALEASLRNDVWYKPLVEIYLGRRDVETLQPMLETAPANNKCTALYFVAQFYLYRMPKHFEEKAKAAFSQALLVCSFDAIERGAARAELERL